MVIFCSIHFLDLLTSMQAFFKLKHESQVEHIFLVKTSGKKSELVLVKFLQLHLKLLLQKNLMIKFGEINDVLNTILMVNVIFLPSGFSWIG